MSASIQQLLLPFQRIDAATFEQFVGSENRLAISTLEAVASGEVQYWCYLVGASGHGKSHLLMAACRRAHDLGRRCGLLTAESLLELGPASLEGLSGLQLVAIDDFDRIATDQEWGEGLFHRVNRWKEEGVTLIASGQQTLRGMTVELPDLRSRIHAITEIRLGSLNSSEQEELLKSRARSMQVEIGDELVGYLLRRETRNPGNLVEILDEIHRASLAEKRRLTIPLAREILDRRKLGP